MNRNNEDLKDILKNFSMYAGIALAIFSIYFSYDGLNSTVGDGNTGYTTLTKVIGFSLAVVVTLIQFIYHVDYENLNKDMKLIGLGSYVYSIWTNFLGIQHMFGFDPMTVSVLAGAMDILPENMIAWGLGTSLEGGVIDNFLKGIVGKRGRQGKAEKREPAFHFDASQTQPRHIPTQHANQPKKGQGRQFLEGQRNQGKHKEFPNRFGGFGE